MVVTKDGRSDRRAMGVTARARRDPHRHGKSSLVLTLRHEQVTEVFTGFGAPRVPAERVARGAVRELVRYRKRGAPVGEHLADQLLLPLAMAGAGEFRTGPLSRHAETNIDVIQRFLPVALHTTEVADSVVVRCAPA